MGNNDSLPPPPPGQPGQPLPPPIPGRALPSPTIAPAASGGGSTVAENVPYVLLGLGIAAILVLGGYLVFRAGRSNGSPNATVLTTIAAPDSTAAPNTLVITAPEDTVPHSTGGSNPLVGPDITVTDDTNLFTVQLPGSFQTDTKPIDAKGTKIAQVSGSENLASYNTTHDTPGVTVIGGRPGELQVPSLLVKVFDPGVSQCTERRQQSNVATALGAAEVLFIDKCGVHASAKVVMSLLTADKVTLVVIAQGSGPASGALLAFARTVLETVSPA